MYSKQQTDIMNALYPDKVISAAELEHRFNVADYHVMLELRHAGMIHPTTDYHSDAVYLTETGKAYIEDLDRDDKRYGTERLEARIAIVISILVLLAAIIALFK